MDTTWTLAAAGAQRPYEWIHRAVENREAVRLMDPNAATPEPSAPASDSGAPAAAWLFGLVLLVVLVPAVLLAAERVRTRWREIAAWRPRRDPLERAFHAARVECALTAAQIAELKTNADGPGAIPAIAQLLAPSARERAAAAARDAIVESKPAPAGPVPKARRSPARKRSPRINLLVAGSAQRLASPREGDAPRL